MSPPPPATAETLMRVYAALDAMHASRGWHWWPGADPFEVCVGAILVQNTSWTNVEHALTALRAAGALTPKRMAALSDDALEALVRPSGQYRQKARKLRAFLQLIDSRGSFPALLALPPEQLRALLLGTWGIGPETADCITLYAAGQPAFIIDAYTIRVFSRLGVGPGAAAPYSEWQDFFTANLPVGSELYGRYHALI
ncbi:MAG: endonuclease III domain-containing protein, partial [Tepidiformaceae bacterium]